MEGGEGLKSQIENAVRSGWRGVMERERVGSKLKIEHAGAVGMWRWTLRGEGRLTSQIGQFGKRGVERGDGFKSQFENAGGKGWGKGRAGGRVD